PRTCCDHRAVLNALKGWTGGLADHDVSGRGYRTEAIAVDSDLQDSACAGNRVREVPHRTDLVEQESRHQHGRSGAAHTTGWNLADECIGATAQRRTDRVGGWEVRRRCGPRDERVGGSVHGDSETDVQRAATEVGRVHELAAVRVVLGDEGVVVSTA